jgi:hypothetical protein
MNFWEKFKEKTFNKVCDKGSVPDDVKAKFKNFGNNMSMLVGGIAKFIILTYIFNKLHDKIGFEKTIIILAVLIVVLLKAYLKPPMIK